MTTDFPQNRASTSLYQYEPDFWLDRLAKAANTSVPLGGLSHASLLSRPRRDPHVSRPAHLMRVAQGNHFRGVKELSAALGHSASTLVRRNDEAINRLLIGLRHDDLAFPEWRSDASTMLLKRSAWVLSKICPLCSREGRLAPLYFDYPLTVRCELHEVLLHDQCPQCLKDLSYLRQSLRHCDCGQRLDQLQIVGSDATVDLFHCIFSPWRHAPNWYLDEDQNIPREIRCAQTISVVLRMISSNGLRLEHVRRRIRTSDWPILQRLLTPWPDALIATLEEIIERISPAMRAQLIKGLRQPELTILHPIATILAEGRRRSPARIKAKINGVQHELVALSSVREFAELDAAAVKQLYYGNFFSIKTITFDKGRHQFWVSAAEAAKLADWFRATVDRETTAHLMGCSAESVLGMVRIKRLSFHALAVKPRSQRFLRAEIDTHLIGLRTLAHRAAVPGPTFVRLDDLPTASRGSKCWHTGWAGLMEGVLTGTIPLFQLPSGRGWQRYVVLRRDALRFLGSCLVPASVPT